MTIYEDGNSEIKTFENTPEKRCNVAMIDYLNELSLTHRMNLINHKENAKDWRFREDLTPEEETQTKEWLRIHKTKKDCDICHKRIVPYCNTCQAKYKKFNEDKYSSDKPKQGKFAKCQSCEAKGANGILVYDHCHLTGKYRSSACNNCNINVMRDSPESYKLPVIFHNAEGYDNKIMLKAMLAMKSKLSENTKINMSPQKRLGIGWHNIYIIIVNIQIIEQKQG